VPIILKFYGPLISLCIFFGSFLPFIELVIETFGDKEFVSVSDFVISVEGNYSFFKNHIFI
jgi:hypothetical protein